MTALLQYFKKFNPLSQEAENAIAEICSIVTIKKNADLQPIGHACKTIYFINKGLARIYYFKDGIDVTESFAFENTVPVRKRPFQYGKGRSTTEKTVPERKRPFQNGKAYREA